MDSHDRMEKVEAEREKRAAEERLRQVRALSPFIRARARRMEALKRQNGFAENIHRALTGGST